MIKVASAVGWFVAWVAGWVLTIMATVPRDEAVSNFATYIEPLGSEWLMGMLSSPFVDPLLTAIGIMLMISIPIYWFWGNRVKHTFIGILPSISSEKSKAIFQHSLDASFKNVRSFKVTMVQGARPAGELESICLLEIQNKDPMAIPNCLVQIEQLSISTPPGMSLPLDLVPKGQGRKDGGRFKLSPGQKARVPILFRRPQRRIDWCFLDANGQRHYTVSREIEMVVAVLGGRVAQRFLITMKIGQDWTPACSIKSVSDGVHLKRSE